MIKLSMYIDGSEVSAVPGKDKAKKDSKVVVGWGIRAHDHETGTREVAQAVRQPTGARGLHEEVAYVNAVRLAERLGYVPSEVAIYTDCQMMAYGSYHLTAGNMSTGKWHIIQRLRRVQKHFFPTDTTLVIRTIRWLMYAHNQWVKGHAGCVDQRRADTLAKTAAKRASGLRSQPVPYDGWLKGGRLVYVGPDQKVRIDWPFVC